MKQDWRTTYYRPMMRKTFEAALTHFVTREFLFLQGTMVVSLFVKELGKLVEAYYPPTSYLRAGQMIWLAVDKNEKLGYKKPITEAKIKPVVLTILHADNIRKHLKGISLDNIRRDAWARVLLEADEQGVVLSEIDIATIFKVSPALVSTRIRAYEKEHRTILPPGGTNIKDTSFVTSMSDGLVRQYVELAKSLLSDNGNLIKQASDGKET